MFGRVGSGNSNATGKRRRSSDIDENPKATKRPTPNDSQVGSGDSRQGRELNQTIRRPPDHAARRAMKATLRPNSATASTGGLRTMRSSVQQTPVPFPLLDVASYVQVPHNQNVSEFLPLASPGLAAPPPQPARQLGISTIRPGMTISHPPMPTDLPPPPRMPDPTRPSFHPNETQSTLGYPPMGRPAVPPAAPPRTLSRSSVSGTPGTAASTHDFRLVRGIDVAKRSLVVAPPLDGAVYTQGENIQYLGEVPQAMDTVRILGLEWDRSNGEEFGRLLANADSALRHARASWPPDPIAMHDLRRHMKALHAALEDWSARLRVPSRASTGFQQR